MSPGKDMTSFPMIPYESFPKKPLIFISPVGLVFIMILNYFSDHYHFGSLILKGAGVFDPMGCLSLPTSSLYQDSSHSRCVINTGFLHHSKADQTQLIIFRGSISSPVVHPIFLYYYHFLPVLPEMLIHWL